MSTFEDILTHSFSLWEMTGLSRLHDLLYTHDPVQPDSRAVYDQEEAELDDGDCLMFRGEIMTWDEFAKLTDEVVERYNRRWLYEEDDDGA